MKISEGNVQRQLCQAFLSSFVFSPTPHVPVASVLCACAAPINISDTIIWCGKHAQTRSFRGQTLLSYSLVKFPPPPLLPLSTYAHPRHVCCCISRTPPCGRNRSFALPACLSQWTKSAMETIPVPQHQRRRGAHGGLNSPKMGAELEVAALVVKGRRIQGKRTSVGMMRDWPGIREFVHSSWPCRRFNVGVLPLRVGCHR